MPEEVARGLGVSKDKVKNGAYGAKQLLATTSVFDLEHLSESLSFPSELQPIFQLNVDNADGNLRTLPNLITRRATVDDHQQDEAPVYPIDWKPPALSEGGVWYNE